MIVTEVPRTAENANRSTSFVVFTPSPMWVSRLKLPEIGPAPVLTAADVVEIRVRQRVADADADDLEGDAAPPAAVLEHGDIAAVGVDVQVFRIQVADADLHAARSQ